MELLELRQTTSTVQCPACWKHSRTNGAVFMRKLISTRRAHGEPDRAQIRRTCQTVPQSLGEQITRATTRDIFLWKARDATRGAGKNDRKNDMFEVSTLGRSSPMARMAARRMAGSTMERQRVKASTGGEETNTCVRKLIRTVILFCSKVVQLVRVSLLQ